LIACGIWLHVNRDSLTVWPLFVDNHTDPVVVVDQVPVALVVLGLIFAVMSFLGCCGTCVDSVCFLGFVSIDRSVSRVAASTLSMSVSTVDSVA